MSAVDGVVAADAKVMDNAGKSATDKLANPSKGEQ